MFSAKFYPRLQSLLPGWEKLRQEVREDPGSCLGQTSGFCRRGGCSAGTLEMGIQWWCLFFLGSSAQGLDPGTEKEGLGMCLLQVGLWFWW